MHFARDDFTSDRIIRAYSDGRITVGDTEYRRSLILSNERIIDDWQPQRLDELTGADLQRVLEIGPEVFLLGTGKRLSFPTPGLTAALLEAGIGVEIMDTAAACRTYNILLGEHRHVAAALLLI